MFGFFRGMTRLAIVTGAAVGVGCLIFGTQRMIHLYSTAKQTAAQKIDSMMDQRSVLERELKRLQEAYPVNIAEGKIQKRELEKMIAENRDSLRVYQNVVALCDDDLRVLEAKIAKHEAGGEVSAGVAAVEFKGVKYTYAETLDKMNRAAAARLEYEQKIRDVGEEIKIVEEQVGDLEEYLGRLEKEYQEFLAQVNAMRRDIAVIERNERLIAMVRKVEGIRAGADESGEESLESIRSKIAEKRLRQTEFLKSLKLGRSPAVSDYETRARLDVSRPK